jgi:hypothetical protein
MVVAVTLVEVKSERLYCEHASDIFHQISFIFHPVYIRCYVKKGRQGRMWTMLAFE